jgi:hypothetical protein
MLLAVGMRAAFWLRAPVFIIPDSENYFYPGYQLAQGYGLAYLEARRAPLYPTFIGAVVLGIGRDLAALALAQHALGVLAVGLTYLIGRLTFGRVAGLLAGAAVALNGSLLMSEQSVSTEALFLVLTLGACLAAIAGSQRSSRPLLLIAGLLLGLASLTRSVGLGLALLVPFSLAAFQPGWRAWLRDSATFALGIGLILLPWMTRNLFELRVFSTEGAFGQTLVGRTVRHDRFVFVDPNDATDADPQRQRAREQIQDAANRGSFITPLRRRLMQELNLSSELEANRLMRDLAVEAILRQPGYYALSTGRFFVQLAVGWPDRLRDAWQTRRDPEAREEWEALPQIAPLLGPPTPLQERQFGEADALVGVLQPSRLGLVWLALFGLGCLATLLGPALFRYAFLPALWAIGLLLIGVAFVGPVLRYRYPAEPYLSLLVAGGIVWLVDLLSRRRPRRSSTSS